MKKRMIVTVIIAFVTLLFCMGCSKQQDKETIEKANADEIHPKLISHGGGEIYGFRITNSKEALDLSYENGFRVVELDFERTTDGEYVLLHDWEFMSKRLTSLDGCLNKNDFLKADTFVDLTLMDLSMLLSWLEEHKDCYIITDTKGDNLLFLQSLYEKAGDMVNYFIPQAYSYEEYMKIKTMGYDSVILTLYKMPIRENDAIVTFAKEQKPWAIVMPYENADGTLLKSLSEEGVYTYLHTVNDLYIYETWSEYGLHGIYTDYFVVKHWPYQ